ncbi:hypothetical protein D3C78_1621820 [compost metagenome]
MGIDLVATAHVFQHRVGDGDNRFELQRIAHQHGPACAPQGADGGLRSGLAGFVDQQPADLAATEAAERAGKGCEGAAEHRDGHEQRSPG